jgi:hypothetical protein
MEWLPAHRRWNHSERLLSRYATAYYRHIGDDHFVCHERLLFGLCRRWHPVGPTTGMQSPAVIAAESHTTNTCWSLTGEKREVGSADGCGHVFASLGRWGDGGMLAGEAPPHINRESDHNKTRPARPCCKRRRGDDSPAPFCCPSTKEMEFDFDLVAVFTRRARDIKVLMRASE